MAEDSGDADTLLTVTVQFPIKFAVVVAVFVAVLSIIFLKVSDSWTDTLIFIAAVSAAGGTIVSAFYIGRTLNLSLSQDFKFRAREDALDERGKKERALGYGARWNDPHMHWARDICRQLYSHRNSTQPQVLTFIQDNETNVTNLLNFFEEMAHAIDNDLVDEQALRGQFAGHVTGSFQIAKPYVDQLRIQRGRPLIWRPLEDLCAQW